ncbi:probable isoprenylcysteine alpha-carbonyl methylesterase ICME [Callorhinchus milii]|uniref:probable isoprenylcysteine alpha-carbonyl methylesterase ICME n=1 Tax=Callorhinchus milii TaxID=7868 RepID=UPI001C3FE834|nr:probable isoprenylcysteine alpha-carbonyl methylesterase ICME [Callorhinchus milii]
MDCNIERLAAMYPALITAGMVSMGIFYSLAGTIQWMYGWPNKPGYRKYIEGMYPRRVYCLTIALLGMLRYIQYTKLYIQCNSLYKSLNDSNKGITFGRHGNKLDVFIPKYQGFDQSSTYLPVIIFIYGGAWGSGQRATYCLLALQVATELNAVVICPDYSIYPKGSVVEMVQDVTDSISWIKENGNRYNCDKDRIIFIGHSAGAHLCALTTLFLAGENEELGIDKMKQNDLLASVKGFIGLSGVYHIANHYKHEQWRGIEYVSTMQRAMKGIDHFDHYSPTLVVNSLPRERLRRLPRFALLHGTKDKIVPVDSTVKFSHALTFASGDVALHLLPEIDHINIIMDLMDSKRKYYHLLFGYFKREIDTFLNK